ncbi:MAG: hypothetical protein LQ351_007534 [Letrouitia transgressa]|nr:MAG: hypothetical protein LQ351_007534 [Letrouitia transgressa]
MAGPVPQDATQLSEKSNGPLALQGRSHLNTPTDYLATTVATNGSAGSPTLDTFRDLERVELNDEKGRSSSVTDIQNQEPVDPNIVDWTGPDDPEKPTNWSTGVKMGIVTIISSITFLTPLASSMFAPGVPEVMTEFKSTNIELASFVVSIYILGYAFGPLVIAPMSELYGRLWVYHVCNLGFIIFTVACAVASDINMLTAFRFFEGLFGSAPVTIGGGSIADMIVQEKRGKVMSIWVMGPLLGPIIGPVAGGYLSEAKGWRWVFWVIAIAAGAISLVALFLLRETYPPVLLKRKAKKLRQETGNNNLRAKFTSDLPPGELFRLAIVRPLKMLCLSPIVLALSTFMAVVYGYLYLLFTTITEVFEQNYGFSSGAVGLTYLGIGVGNVAGLFIFGMASDRIVKRLTKNGEMKPEYRLPPMIPGAFVIPIGLFIYGWTAENHVHWIVPIIGTGLVGIGLLATFMPIQSYLVDAYTLYASSALAASAIERSLLGGLLPLAGRKMYDSLGLGWGNSLLGFIATALCPIPIVLFYYGERIRKSKRFELHL